MNQHICLFLVAAKLNRDKQRDFFYRMSTALGYDEGKMLSLSAIYAHYGIFSGQLLSASDLSKAKRNKACPDCKALCRKTMYKEFPIQEEACPLCIFSPDYRNARERDERMVLRYFLMPDTVYEHIHVFPENAFYSRMRLCDDYAAGTYPVIPFHLFLYEYLENHTFRPANEDDFLHGLLDFISERINFQFDIKSYTKQIQTGFRVLLQIDDISPDTYRTSAERLGLLYSYCPPPHNLQPAAITVPGNPLCGSNSPAKLPKTTKSNTTKDTPKTTENSTTRDTPETSASNTTKDIPETTANNTTKDTPETTKINNNRDTPETTKINNIRDTPETVKMPAETDTPHIIPSVKPAEEITQHKKESCTLTHSLLNQQDFYVMTDFSPEFESCITILQKDSHFSFITELSQNTAVAMEPVIYHKNAGILLYLVRQQKFYFYDTSLSGTEMLTSALTSPELLAISYYPVQIMQMLQLPLCHQDCIQSLDAAYYLANGQEPDYNNIFHQERCNCNSDSILKHSMPLYHDTFLNLMEKISADNKSSQYRRLLRLFSFMADAEKAKDITRQLKPYITEDGYLNYRFSFQWGDSLCSRGYVFQIASSDFSGQTKYLPDSFLTDICLCFYNFPHSTRKHCSLLSITDKAMYVYYNGTHKNAMQFYDSVMHQLRVIHGRHFSIPFSSSTVYAEYK